MGGRADGQHYPSSLHSLLGAAQGCCSACAACAACGQPALLTDGKNEVSFAAGQAEGVGTVRPGMFTAVESPHHNFQRHAQQACTAPKWALSHANPPAPEHPHARQKKEHPPPPGPHQRVGGLGLGPAEGVVSCGAAAATAQDGPENVIRALWVCVKPCGPRLLGGALGAN